ncbi:hypothetical protein H1230_02150 [Paenibacillus sp. 19GGS1-52]|uniref:hypothetical protein n=1 Tax=Paenibacillus sp. 19GGS1-52 TaxID=2758563 RepID=UPI001EFC118A|nr:hypothetical protein [Paenibacillus sp. 19GGS1-52]ULO07700.1 hypothetical protein H1230_02150 [Paenibacillus sp. 19GGS1-52]
MYTTKNKRWIILISVIFLLTACNRAPNAATKPQQTPSQTPSQTQEIATSEPTAVVAQTPGSTEQPIEEGMPPTALEAATTVMRAIKDGNMKTLAAWAHPQKGVRFSPYAYVDTLTDLVFTREELEGLMADSTKRVWRTFAGSGDLIEMTFAQYYKQFVYDADFFQDAKIALNKGLGQGTTINNLNEVYPEDSYDFVEYHIDGIDPLNEGMDWRSLRLVFEKIGEDHALVGIIHDQWTP